MQEIRTGVDSLVDLIKQKHNISLEEASKTLGVPSAVINDWAEYLEGEKVISIQYKGTTPFLTEATEVQLSKEQTLYVKEVQEDLTRIKQYEPRIKDAELDKRNLSRIEFINKVKLQYSIIMNNLQEFVSSNSDDLETFKKIKRRLLIFERNILEL